MRGVERVGRPVSLVLILACTCGTMILGSALKAPCATGTWGDGRAVPTASATRTSSRCSTPSSSPGTGSRSSSRAWRRRGQCDEYPVLTMYFMRVAAWVGEQHDRRASSPPTPPPLVMRRRDRHVPVHVGRQGVVVRARAHAADLRLHELGSVRGGVRDRRPGCLRAPPRRARGRVAGPRRGCEVLSGDARAPADRATAARPGARLRDQDRLGDRGNLAAREPAVRRRVSIELVDVLPVQLDPTRGLGQPVVHRMQAPERHRDLWTGPHVAGQPGVPRRVRLDVRAGVDVETTSRAELRAGGASRSR